MVNLPKALIAELERVAAQLCLDMMEMIHHRGAGHPGGSLSAAEIVAALYFHHLRIDPFRPVRDAILNRLKP